MMTPEEEKDYNKKVNLVTKKKLGRPRKDVPNPNNNIRRVLYLPTDGSPIDNLLPISKGFYGFKQDGGRKKQLTKHILRVYTDAMYILKSMINQFETLQASVATEPEAGVFMSKKVEYMKKMLRSVEIEHTVVNERLQKINHELELARTGGGLPLKNNKRKYVKKNESLVLPVSAGAAAAAETQG